MDFLLFDWVLWDGNNKRNYSRTLFPLSLSMGSTCSVRLSGGESSLELPLVLGLASLSCFCLLQFVSWIVNLQMIFHLSDKNFTWYVNISLNSLSQSLYEKPWLHFCPVCLYKGRRPHFCAVKPGQLVANENLARMQWFSQSGSDPRGI